MVIISIVVLFFRFLPQMSPDSPVFPATIPAPWQRFFSDAHYFILFFTLAALPSAFPGNKKAEKTEKGKERVGTT
ncbi:hypothetical protein [Phocaeicola massiliensis]|uniref:hypothetical protein n=1 Tax=Phocaeicola massiliensis TaxID=204516 RepID=UPI00319DD2F8